jgi:putative transposon-encoded protein
VSAHQHDGIGICINVYVMSGVQREKTTTKRKVVLRREKIVLEDSIAGFFEKVVTKFGTGAKIDCPRAFIGKRVYVVVCEQ